METRKLVVFDDYILDIGCLQLGGLCDFLLFLTIERLQVVLLCVVHGGADLVLSLEDFNLSILTPDHHAEGGLLLEAVEHTLVEVVQGEGILGQEVLYIVCESLFILVFLAFFHSLHEGSLSQLQEG